MDTEKNLDKKSKNLDQFYTKTKIAEKFVKDVLSIIDYTEFDNVIEPSAGAGRILDFMPSGSIGLDLDPQREDIIKIDFFDYEFPKGKNLVIGNPPFGRNSKLALRFFNRCAENADVIAFLIPRNWNSHKKQKHLHKDFDLIRSVVIPDNSFTLDGKDYKVKCVAQIWVRKSINKYEATYDSWNELVSKDDLDEFYDYYRANKCMNTNELFSGGKSLRFNKSAPNKHKDFKTCYFVPTCWTNTVEFVDNAYNKSDWFMRYVGGSVLGDADKTKGAWIGFYDCKTNVREVMEQTDWSFLHITKTAQPTIGTEDIIYAYER